MNFFTINLKILT